MAKYSEIKYLIDIGHPAHVHYFKNFASYVINKGNSVLFTCRNKEVTKELLIYYGYNFISFGKSYRSLIGKLFGLFYFTLRIFIVALKYRPDFYLNASIYSAIVAWISKKPHVALEDTFNREQVSLYLPFTSCILAGDYPHPSLGEKELLFKGYSELAYLHPNRFNPDRTILKELGIAEKEKYVIIRFVSWNASHDIGHKGINISNKLKAVKEISKYARVFISAEGKLPVELERYKLSIPAHQMHNLLAYSYLLFGESSTMAEEAAILGIPSIYLFNNSTYYTQHLEKEYGILFNFSESLEDQEKAINKSIELLKMPKLKEIWKQKQQKLLNDKIDVTKFFIWFIECWPESFRIIKENPDFQYQFK